MAKSRLMANERDTCHRGAARQRFRPCRALTERSDEAVPPGRAAPWTVSPDMRAHLGRTLNMPAHPGFKLAVRTATC
jgi:hypothetical protein